MLKHEVRLCGFVSIEQMSAENKELLLYFPENINPPAMCFCGRTAVQEDDIIKGRAELWFEYMPGMNGGADGKQPVKTKGEVDKKCMSVIRRLLKTTDRAEIQRLYVEDPVWRAWFEKNAGQRGWRSNKLLRRGCPRRMPLQLLISQR